MTPIVPWLCFTLLPIAMYMTDVTKEMIAFRKCTQEEQCDAPLAELKPCGILQSFSKCLQFASCSYVRFSPKALVCMICMTSNNVSSRNPRNSETDEDDWMCPKRRSSETPLPSQYDIQDPCSACQPGSRCVKSRSGETKCVHSYFGEQIQGKGRMPTQAWISAPLRNMTKEDLKNSWTTTRIQEPEIMISLTWSPSFANHFYCLSKDGSRFVIKLYIYKLNSLEKQVRWENVAIPGKDGTDVWSAIDTGRCLTNDGMPCIFVFKRILALFDSGMHLRSYREVTSPHHLQLERKGDINRRCKSSMLFCVFAYNWKFGLAVYLKQMFKTPESHLLQVGEGGFTFKELRTVTGLNAPTAIKWNYDGSFAFAISKTHIFVIRYFDDKQQVMISVEHGWKGYFTPVWVNTTVLVFQTTHEGEVQCIRYHQF